MKKREIFYFFISVIILMIIFAPFASARPAQVYFSSDASFTDTRTTFTQGQTIYSKVVEQYGGAATNYYAEWRNPAVDLVRRALTVYSDSSFTDSHTLSTGASLGDWEAAYLHNPNYADWYIIEFLEPENGNLLEGSEATFKFRIISRDGTVLTSDNTDNLELFLRYSTTTEYDWIAASSWDQGGPFVFNSSDGTYSCTWIAQETWKYGGPPASRGEVGGLFGARYYAAGGAETGDEYSIPVSNTISFTAANPVSTNSDRAKIVFLPYNGPDISNYPAHLRFGDGATNLRLKWIAYQMDYNTIDTSGIGDNQAFELELIEGNDYNENGAQSSVSVSAYTAESENLYADLNHTDYNAGKYSVRIEYSADHPQFSTNFQPENKLVIFLNQYKNFTVQTPPVITAETYTLRRTDYASYPENKVTRGQTAAFEVAVANSGAAGLKSLNAASSYLTFNDGTGNSYTAYLSASSDSLISSGETAYLTFTSAQIPSGFLAKEVSNVQVVLNGSDTNNMTFPNSGSDYTINLSDTITVQNAPDIRYGSGLTQTLKGAVDNPHRNVTQGQENVVLALKLTNYAADSSLTAADTITLTDTISFNDGVNFYTAYLSSPVYIAAGETQTLTFNLNSGDTIDETFTVGSYNPVITIINTDANGYSFTKTVNVSDQITVQAPPSVSYNDVLEKVTPPPSSPTVTLGTNVNFKVEVINSGGVALTVDTATTSLSFGDGAETYSAGLSETHTITSGGGTSEFEFDLSVLPAGMDTGLYNPVITLAGEDANGRAFTASINISDTITVKSPPNIVYVSGLSPVEATQGQTGVSFSAVFKNTGEAGITLSTARTYIEFGDGAETFTAYLSAAKTLNQNGTAAFTFSAQDIPANITGGGYNPKIFLADTDVYGKYISDSALITDNVTIYALSALHSSLVNYMPSYVSKEQADVDAAIINFADTSGGGSGIKLSGFIIDFKDTGGAEQSADGVLSSLKAYHANGVDTPLLQTISNPADTYATINLGGAKYFESGGEYPVLIRVSFTSSAAAGTTLSLHITNASKITAADSVSDASLTSSGIFPLASDTVYIQNKAQLSVSTTNAMPAQIAQGRTNIRSQNITFSAASPGADAVLNHFYVSFIDDDAADYINFGEIADTVWITSSTDTYFFTITNDTRVKVDFSGTPQTIAAGSSKTYRVFFNVYDTAVANTNIRTQIKQAGDISAVDNNSDAAVGVTGSYPATSNAAQVINKAGMNVAAADSMPASVDPGQTLVRSMMVTFSNDVDEPGESANINGFWLHFQDTNGNPVDVYEMINSLTIKDVDNDETLYDNKDINPGDTAVYIDFALTSPGSVVPTPPPLKIDVFLNFSSKARADSTVKTVIYDTNSVNVEGSNSGNAIEAEAPGGWQTVQSSVTVINELVASVNTFRDEEFFFGSTTFAKEQRVYAKVIGLAPTDNYGIYWYDHNGALVQADTYEADGSGDITADSYVIDTGDPAGVSWQIKVVDVSLSVMDTAVFTVQNKAEVTLSFSNQMPSTSLAGQSNITPFVLTFQNSASAPASQLKLISFYVEFQDAEGAAKNIRNIISAIRVYQGATERHNVEISTEAGEDTRLLINFNVDDVPLISAGNQAQLTFYFDIAEGAAGNTLKFIVPDSISVLVRDENSMDTVNVPKYATPDWDSIKSSHTTILNPAALQTSMTANNMPATVSQGQTNIHSQTLKFENSADTPSSTVELSEFTLTLTVKDENGNDTGISGLLDWIKIEGAFGNQTINNPASKTLSFNFGGAQYLEYGESLPVKVLLSFSSGAPAGYKLRTALVSSDSITAEDSTNGGALTSGGSFELSSDTTTIQGGAELYTNYADYTPSKSSREQTFKASDFYFGNSGDSYGADVRLKGFILRFRDEDNAALNINGVVESIKINFNGADTQSYSITSDTSFIYLPVHSSYKTISAEDTLTAGIYIEITSDAPIGQTLYYRLAAAAQVFAEDGNYSEGAGGITTTGSFALDGAVTTIQDSASLSLTQTSYMPAKVSQGQQKVRTQRVVFTALGADVQTNSFIVNFKDGADADVNIYNQISAVHVYNGAETFSYSITSSPTYSVTITDTSSKRYIATSSPVNYDIFVDINTSATKGTVFRTQITDSTSIDAYDSNTQTAVKYITLSAEPLTSDTTIIYTRAQLNISSTDHMPSEVSQGQQNVAAQTFTFAAGSSDAPQAGVRLDSFYIDFKSGGGGEDRDISALSDTLTVVVSQTDTYSVSASGYDTALFVDFTNASFGGSSRYIEAGSSITVKLIINIKTTAAAGTTLRTQITASSRINSADSVSGLSMTSGRKTLSATPLNSSATTIKEKAGLSVSRTSFMPSYLSQGQADEHAVTFGFQNTAAAGGADLKLNNFKIRVVDENGSNLSPKDIISSIKVRDAQTADVYTYNNPDSLTTVDFSGTPKTVEAAATSNFEVYVTIHDTATAGKIFRLRITSAAKVSAEDANSGLSVTPSNAFPLSSDNAQIQIPAALYLSATTQPRSLFMDETTQQGAAMARMAAFHFNNSAEAANGAQGVLNEFVIHFKDENGDTLNIFGIIDDVRIRRETGSETTTLQTFNISGQTNNLTVDFDASPRSINAGDTLTLGIYVNVGLAASVGATLRVQMNDTPTIDFIDNNTQLAVSKAAASLPLVSDTTKIIAAVPTAESFFNSARTTAQENFSKGQTVYMKYWGLAGLTDYTARWVDGEDTSYGNYVKTGTFTTGSGGTIETDERAFAAADTAGVWTIKLYDDGGANYQTHKYITVYNTAAVTVSGTSTIPSSVIQEQTDIYAHTLNFANTGDTPYGADAKINSFTLSFFDEDDNALNIRDYFDSIKIDAGSETFTYSRASWGESQKTLTVSFGGDPRSISSGSSEDYKVVLAVRSSAPAGNTIKTALTSADSISAIDANSNSSITASGAFSIESDTTLIKNKAGLTAYSTDFMPALVSQTQKDVKTQQFSFVNSAASPAGDLKFTAFRLNFTDADDNDTNLNLTAETITVAALLNGSTDTFNVDANALLSYLWVDFSNDTFGNSIKYLGQGETLYVTVYLSFKEDAAPGATLKTRIADGTESNFTVSDSATGNTLTSAGFGGGALASSAVTVQKYAHLTLSKNSLMPSYTAQGSENVDAIDFYFMSDASPSGASVKLYSFSITVQDTDSADITPPSGIIKKITVVNANGSDTPVLQEITAPASATQTIDFEGTPQTISAGDTLTLRIRIDIYDTATASATVKIVLSETQTLNAKDNNIDADTLSAASLEAFPLESAVTTILSQAALEVSSVSNAPLTALRDARWVDMADISFHALENRTNVELESFYIDFQDESSNPLSVNNIISSLVVEWNGQYETYPASPPFSSGETSVLVNFGAASQYITSGETLTVKIYLNISSHSNAAGKQIKAVLSSAARVTAFDTDSGNPVTPSGAFALASDTVYILNRARLHTDITDNMPLTVSRGQTNVDAGIYEFENIANAPSRVIHFSSFRLYFQDETGSDTDISLFANSIKINIDGETYSYTTAASQTSLLVDVDNDTPDGAASPSAKYISAQNTLSANVYFNIKSSAPLGQKFKVVLKALTDITCSDSTTAVAIPSSDKTGDTPLASSLTTVQRAAALSVTNDASVDMPSTVSQGEANISAHRFIFQNSASSPAASVELTSFKIHFQDEGSNDTDIYDSIKKVTVKHQANTLLEESITAPAEFVTVTVPAGDKYLAAGETYSINVYIDIFDTALAGKRIQTRVKKDSSSISASDTNSGAQITTFGGNINIISTRATRVQAKAAVHITHIDDMPDTVLQGDADVSALTLNLNNTADTPDFNNGATARIEGLRIDFYDTNGNPRTVDSILSAIKVKNKKTDVTLQTINNPTGSYAEFDLGGARTINAGDSLILEFVLDFKTTATSGLTLQLRLVQASRVTAKDNNYYTNGSASPEITPTADFPLSSSVTLIESTTGAIQTYKESGRTTTQTSFSKGQTVYFKAWGLIENYEYSSHWDSPDTIDIKVVDPDQTDGDGVLMTASDFYYLSDTAPTGLWTVRVMDEGDTKASINFNVVNPAEVSLSDSSYGDTILPRAYENFLIHKFVFENTAETPAARVKVDSFVLTFADADGDTLDVSGLLNKITVKQDGAEAQTINSPSNSATVNFGGASLVLSYGETSAIEIYIDIDAAATPKDTLRIRLTAPSYVYAYDNNSDTRISSGGDFEMISDTVTVQYTDTGLSTVAGDPLAVKSDGADESEITITLKDKNGAAISGFNVTLFSSRGATDDITQPASATDASGQTKGYVSSTSEGDAVIYAVCAESGDTLEATVTITFAPAISAAANALTVDYSEPGDTNIVILSVTISNIGTVADTVSSLEIINAGSAADSELIKVYIYKDENANGVFDEGVDSLTDSGVFDGGDTIFYNVSSITIAAGDSQTFFVLVDLHQNATENDTIDALINIHGINMEITTDTVPIEVLNSSGYRIIKRTPPLIDTQTLAVNDTQTVLYLADLDGSNSLQHEACTIVVVISDTSGVDTASIFYRRDGVLAGAGDTEIVLTNIEGDTWRGVIAKEDIAAGDIINFIIIAVDIRNNQTIETNGDTGFKFTIAVAGDPSIQINFPGDEHDTTLKRITVSGTTANTFAGDTVAVFVNGELQDILTLTELNGAWSLNNVRLTGSGDSVWVKLTSSDTAVYDTITVNYSAPAMRVVINEVNWSGGIGADGYQFIELYNLTDAEIDLSSYYITLLDTVIVSQTEFNGKAIGAYDYFVITPNAGILPGISADIVSDSWTDPLAAGGENIILYKNSAEIEDEVLAKEDGGWYAGDGVNYYSMERKNPSVEGDSESNWLSSTGTYTYGGGAGRGSPKAANTVSILTSIVSGGIAVADGSSTAPVSVVLRLDNNNPVKNHGIQMSTTFGTLTDAPGAADYGETFSYITNDTGQIFAYVKSAESGIGIITVSCTQTTVTALSDEGTVRFLDESGIIADDGGEYTASVSSVTVIDSSADAGAAGNNFIVSPAFSKDGTRLAYIQGDFSQITGADPSDRAIYKYDISTGQKLRLTPKRFNPSPFGSIGWADVNGDGNEDVIFTGWMTAYGSPFWCVMWAKADGSDSEDDIWPDGRNLHPSNTIAPVHWADITDSGHMIEDKEYNIAASVNGRLVVYPSEWAATTEYFSRHHSVQQPVLLGFQDDNVKYRTYYWADVRWDKTGNRIIMTRLDLREFMLKESHGYGHTAATNVFQSEIWMLKNVSDHIGNPIDPIAGHPDLIRISPQTIADTELSGTDGIYGNTDDPSDTIYMMPSFSRGNVVTYSVDRTGTFNRRTLMTAGPNAAFNSTVNFDIVMKYVGTENYIDNACTYSEVSITYDTGNQLSLNWNFSGDANMAMLSQNPNNSDKLDLKLMELSSQSYIDENGGIIFDNGIVTAVVPSDALATGTVLSTNSSSIDEAKEVYSDTMIASGAAREFFPHGASFSDSVQLIIHYTDADLAALGITPGSAEEAQLKIFYWNGAEWADYGGIVNTTNKTITIITDHFSKYALFIIKEPHPLKSTINTDKSAVNADGIDFAELTVKLINADTLPLKSLKVKIESSRSDYDTIVYVNDKTNDSGEVKVRVYSSVAGKSEFKVKNLGNRFTDTATVDFALPKDGTGLVAFDNFPELTMYVPAAAFDTDVIIVIQEVSEDKRAVIEAAKNKEKLLRNTVFLDETDTSGIYEINIYRKSDSALMNNALENPIEMRYYPQNGGIDIITLRFMYLNEATEEWVELETEIPQDNSYVYYNAPHFSIYSIASVSADSVVGSVKDAIVYPNPWRADRHSSNARYGVKFVLPKDRVIEIQLFNISGQRIVRETVNTSTDWVYRWDLTNSRGRQAASGVYIYMIYDKNTGERKTGKTAVIR